MYPHHAYYRGNPGPAGYPARNPFLFGAPLVGGLLGGFLGSALFNYPRPYPYPPPSPYGYGASPTARGQACHTAAEAIPLIISKNGLHKMQTVFHLMISTSDRL